MSEDWTKHLKIEEVGEVMLATLLDKNILGENAEALPRMIGKKLFELVEMYGKKKMVVDLRLVHYLDDTMLGKLASLSKKMNAANGKLIFCGLRRGRQPRESIQIGRFDRIWTIKPNRRLALKEF